MFDYSDLLGKRFAYGERGPAAYDCYTLAQEVYRRNGIVLPDFASPNDISIIHGLLIKGEEFFIKLDAPEYLSIVTFRVIPKYVSHIGVVLNGNNFIHASSVTGVCVERLDSMLWNMKIAGFYKFKGSKCPE